MSFSSSTSSATLSTPTPYLSEMLRQLGLPTDTWGFIIIRTADDFSHNKKFVRALAELDTQIEQAVRKSAEALARPGRNRHQAWPYFSDSVISSYKNIIIEGPGDPDTCCSRLWSYFDPSLMYNTMYLLELDSTWTDRFLTATHGGVRIDVTRVRPLELEDRGNGQRWDKWDWAHDLDDLILQWMSNGTI